MRRSIGFLFGDAWREIADVDPTTTALDWLRLVARKTGTKEGCAEGDCGACTIVVGRRVDGAMRYEPVDSCIRLLATLDGCHVLTVEHLADAGVAHPVQRAMVETHATQCGFCTPGFVMSLFALWLNDPSPSDAAIEEALQGNLCRCTGYAPIIEAGRRMGASSQPDRARFAGIAARAAARLAGADQGSFAFGAQGRTLFSPTSVDELASLCAEHPDATIVAGATDVGLWITKRLERPAGMIWLGRVEALRAIEAEETRLSLGAAVTYAEARAPLAAAFPALDAFIRRIGGAQIRAMGTIGGNIANGSPIGDMPPALIALGATLTMRSTRGRRELPLEDYFLDYGKQDRARGEFVERVAIGRLGARDLFRVWKISKRRDEDISSVCGAFRLSRAPDGAIMSARIAFGGMAATPRRARAAEAALAGQPWTRPVFRAAADALAADFTPIDDWRASAAYRMRVAKNLFERLYLDGAGDVASPAGAQAHG